MATAIRFDDVRVEYRSSNGPIRALDGFDLEVPEGGVFGFLGANGAGKTTAIRAALGLRPGSEGRIHVLGEEAPRHLGRCIDRVGALVEQPSFFPNFSGRRNLDLLARSRGIGADRVDSALERTGLTDRAESRFATYSLGMKQRLGIASVLLKEPELLILDEPANGLDPNGMIEIRMLMRALADEGRTVFVSSHILSEIEQSCDQVAVVSHGRCVATGTVDELLGVTSRYRVQCDDPRAYGILTGAGLDVSDDGDGALVVDVGDRPSEAVTRMLAEVGIYLSELTPLARTLESVYLQLTEEPS